VLGVGGIGGLLGGALAQDGQDVLLILRPEALAAYPGGVWVESAVVGEIDVDVPAASRLDRPVDVLWVTVKATQLEEALRMASPAVAGEAVVVPLLNGVEHVDRLRSVYGDAVIPGAIRVESERVGIAHVVQTSPFAAVELAPTPALRKRAHAIARELRSAGIACRVRSGEADMLWGKLAFLAPLALATSAAQLPLGGVRADSGLRDLMLAAAREACAVAAAEGAHLEPGTYEQRLLTLPEQMRSSMQKDLAARRPLELDAIAGPVLRAGRRHGIPTPATEELARQVASAQAL
jgi:2-dehydropantoate 2-reductase